MSGESFHIRLNAENICSVVSFAVVRNKLNAYGKDVYFIRSIGYDEHTLDEFERADEVLSRWSNDGSKQYICIDSISRIIDASKAVYYANTYEQWKQSGYKHIAFESLNQNEKLHSAFDVALSDIYHEFQAYVPNLSESICKNFIAKILYWTDSLFGECLKSWSMQNTYRLIVSGNLHVQEYLLLYMMTKIGFDVFIYSPEGELSIPERLLEKCAKIEHSQKGKLNILDKHNTTKNAVPSTSTAIKQPQNPSRLFQEVKSPLHQRQELDFEQLAQFASSVVMIGGHDEKGQVFASGSGIIIGKDGYILTNCHVIRGGVGFYIRMENREEPYETQEVIKYNQNLDLALLRIDVQLKPIKLYQEQVPLVRGQKVVAIGSPLGFFNSVSNGIISGFRQIDYRDMIQFTAPISPGSSGGAVLNMFGELIGISTSGFDEGQNINLAVDYKTIKTFIRGFLQ